MLGAVVCWFLVYGLLQAADAQVGCVDNDVRLRGSSILGRGRVELCINNVWGTVCDDLWSDPDAVVVCKQLGFSRHGANAVTSAVYGQGTGPIHLDDVICTGTEQQLISCPHRGVGSHNCRHDEDAGVECNPTLRCIEGAVQLVGGSGLHEGRVEVCVNEDWGTVCHNFWSTVDANVVCRQLGYPRINAQAYSNARFGSGTGLIVMDDVQCVGTEAMLTNCPHSTHTSDCSHADDAGVTCVLCIDGDLRLVGGSTELQGRVELCNDNRWGTVCDDLWDNSDADVACRQLGHSEHNATAQGWAWFGPGTGPILLDDVRCSGTEQRLVDCSHRPIGNHNCGHIEDAGVTCQANSYLLHCANTYLEQCSEGDIQLVGGQFPYEGRVEVCFNEVWGTVCHDFWNNVDAQVACRQLGFVPEESIAYRNARFGGGTGPIVMDNVGCRGSENGLINCAYDPDASDCNHGDDAGVRCGVCVTGSIRLVGGPSNRRGRVEVCWDSHWGTVCDDVWDNTDAQVVCRQLGFPTEGARATIQASFGAGTGPIVLDNVGCTGTESRLLDCDHAGTLVHNCVHTEDAGAICPSRCPRQGEVRLVNGGSNSEGRLEVCLGDDWGNVCDEGWSQTDANVICRQLNFSRHNAVAVLGAGFGQGSGPVVMKSVQCSESAYQLTDCQYSIDTTGCSHSRDAGVRCNTTLLCRNGDLRLVGGRTALEGRVEVCWNETWGTVCDGFWGTDDAKVACKQLGFSRLSAVAFTNARFGQGTGPILLDDLRCLGNEARLVDCRHEGVGEFDYCDHGDDAGLRCNEIACENGEVRLAGGESQYEGRVEVCWNEEWGTVCDDNWSGSSSGPNNVRVVCNQLGFNESTHFQILSKPGSGSILLDDVQCIGNERRLVDCLRRPIGSGDCTHSEDVGVTCGQCREGDVRLVDGLTAFEGRVEICLSGQWGTVCDGSWDSDDATVVCRQLDITSSGAMALGGAAFGEGAGLPVVMALVGCSGSETQLSRCSYNGASNVGRCTHSNDAGVRCSTPVPGAPQGVTVVATSGISLTVSWLPPQSAVDLTKYSVNCSRAAYSQLVDSTTLSVNVAGLRPFTDYQCCVSAINSAGTGPKACVNRRTLEAPPTAAPSNVRGFAVSSKSISLSWNSPPLDQRNGMIQEYRIIATEVKTGKTQQYIATSLQKVFSPLHPFYSYKFTVAAFTVGLGPYSSPITVKTFSDVPSGSPQNLTAEATGPTSIQLGWGPVRPDAQNGIITEFTIALTSDPPNSGRQTFTIPDPDTFSYSATSLTPYTTFDCTIAASTVNGTGPFSTSVNVRTDEDVPTGAPQGLAGRALDSTTLRLSWQPPLARLRNGIIRKYYISIIEVETGQSSTYTVSGSRTYTVMSLHPYYNYQCTVAAYTVGLGPYSDLPLTIQMPEACPDGAPVDFAVTDLSATYIDLSWEPPPVHLQNGVITAYTVRVQSVHGSVEHTTSHTSIRIDSLESYQTYTFAVAATTLSCPTHGPFSAMLTHKTDPCPPGRPQNFAVSVLGPTALNLTWALPPVNQQCGEITHFVISVEEVETGRVWEYNATGTSFTVTNLHPYYQYNSKVAGFTVGLGVFTLPITSRTDPDVPSGPPQSITGIATSPRFIILTWDPPVPSQQNGVIVSYTVKLTRLESGVEDQLTTGATNLTINVRPYSTYNFLVAASTTVGMGEFSREVSIRTPEDAPSHSPRDLSGDVLGPYSFRLSWKPPPEEHHNGVIREYRVVCTEHEASRMFTHSLNATEITFDSLHPHYLYNCSVAAVTVDEGNHTAILALRTDEAAPTAAPRSVEVTVLSSTSLHLTWSPPAPESTNGIIRKYEVSIAELPDHLFSLTTSLTVSNLRPYKVYQCRVAAYTVGRGPFSEEVDRRTLPNIPSGPPHGLVATTSDAHTLHLSWLPPQEEDRNGVIVNYTVVVMDVLTGVESRYTTGGLITQLTVGSLHPYYAYQSRVAASTEVGTGPFSQNTNLRMPEAPPSGAPLLPTTVVLGSSAANISWQPPLPHLQNGLIRHYTILLTEVPTGRQFHPYSSPFTFIHLESLHPFYTYRYWVAAVTIAPGPYTVEKNFTTLPDVPGAPRGISVHVIDSRTVNMMWEPPPVDEMNGVIQGYVVVVSGVAQDADVVYTGDTMELSAVVDGLHPHRAYHCKVAAMTSVGTGAFSTTIVHLPEDVPSSPPQRVRGEALGPRAIRVSWDLPPENDRNGIIRSHEIKITEIETGTTFTDDVPSGHSQLEIDSLHPYYQYSISVATVTVGTGPHSVPITVQTEEDAPSSAPQGLHVVILSSCSANLTWLPPHPSDHNGVITRYIVSVEPERGRHYEEEVLGATTLVLTSLTAITDYRFSVAAATSAGAGPFSEKVPATTIEGEPKVGPRGGVAMRSSATVITVSWSPLSLEESRGNVIGYHVKYRPLDRVSRRNLDDESIVINTTSTELEITDLDPRLAYVVALAASTAAGMGRYSNESTVELFQNELFQLHFSGAIICREWLKDGSTGKGSAISEHVAKEVDTGCNCDLSAKYIADSRLLCDSTESSKVVFQARVVSTATANSSELLTHMADWTKSEPLVVVQGVQLKVSSQCSVALQAFDDTTCIPLTLPSFSPTPRPSNVVDPKDKDATTQGSSGGSGGLPVVPVVGAVVGALVLAIAIVAIAVCSVAYLKRRAKSRPQPTLQSIRYDVGMDSISSSKPGSEAGVKLSPSFTSSREGDRDSHIYDYIPETFAPTVPEPRKKAEEAVPNGKPHRPAMAEVRPKPTGAPLPGATCDDPAPTASTFGYDTTSHCVRPAVAVAMATDDSNPYAHLNAGSLEPRRDYMTVGHHEGAIPNPYELLPVMKDQNPYDTPRPTGFLPPENKAGPTEEEEYVDMASPPSGEHDELFN